VVDTVPECKTETVNEAGEVSKIGVQKDERENVEWENDTVEQFSVESKDINFKDDEIENYSLNKSLSVELLEALTELSEDDSDQFDEVILHSDQKGIFEDSKDLGVKENNSSKSFESKLYGKTPEPSHQDRVADIYDKLSDISEHLTKLEKNLRSKRMEEDKEGCQEDTKDGTSLIVFGVHTFISIFKDVIHPFASL